MKFLSLIKRRLAFFSIASALLFSNSAFAETTLAGVKLDDTVQVGTQTLKLNGAGIRYKVVFKVYVAAMYLPELKSTTAEVIALPGTKRMSLTIMRELSSDDLGQRFMDGLRKNLDVSERSKLIAPMLSFGQMFSTISSLKKGDVITFDWIPGTGVVSSHNGKKLGEPITDPNFYNGVLKIWLGEHPADETLKHKLLNDKMQETNR